MTDAKYKLDFQINITHPQTLCPWFYEDLEENWLCYYGTVPNRNIFIYLPLVI